MLPMECITRVPAALKPAPPTSEPWMEVTRPGKQICQSGLSVCVHGLNGLCFRSSLQFPTANVSFSNLMLVRISILHFQCFSSIEQNKPVLEHASKCINLV